ncbi:MAG: hypothetical protein HGB18_04425 [Candidatus Moranbacteria bacterium]|nr:hypothetical protein [Candidatus Moranbacteria bacterium]
MLTAYLAEFNGNRWEAQISTRDLSIRFTEEWVREPDPPAFVAAMRKFNRDILPELEVMSQEGSLLKLEENPDERIYETGEWFARWCALLAGRLLID